jgi:predicted PurR-regulated permease PerM
MKLKIDIDTQTFVRFILVVIGFALLLWGIYIARDALVIIGTALFLSLALNPPVSWIAGRMPNRSRGSATGIAYLIVVLALGLVVFLVVPPIVAQTARFAETVPGLVDQAVSQKPVIEDFVKQYNLENAYQEAISEIESQAGALSKQLGAFFVNLVTGAVTGVAQLIFILVLAFFMLVEGPVWMKRIWSLFEDKDRRDLYRSVVTKMYRVVTGFVNGQVIVAFIGAMSVFAGILIMSFIPALQMPASLALPVAVVVFVMEIIPMVGAVIATVFGGLLLLLTSPIAAVAFVIYYVIYQQIENNIIAPSIQSKTLDLSVLWIITALIIGSSVFGLIGGLISIPIAGCIKVLITEYLDYHKKRQQESSKGVKKLLNKIKSATN